MTSVIKSFAQAENESRSDNKKWGNKQRAANGTSKLLLEKMNGQCGQLIRCLAMINMLEMLFY